MGSRDKQRMEPMDDQAEENGVLFWLNKSGFPVDSFTWDRMWSHIEKIHPEGSDLCRNIQNRSLKPVPMPVVPLNFPKNATTSDRLDAVQKYMRELQYNHTGTQFFEIRKNRPISGLMEVARDMVRDSLPIKCLEAVILGVYLTNGYPGLERFPVSFKSSFNGNVHRHVVLGVFHGGKFGAIGMSRRDDLMYKPLQFNCLSDMIFDFQSSYQKYLHSVKKIKIGLPVSHDPHSFEQISWKILQLNMNTMTRVEILREVEKHSKEIRTQSRLRDMYDSGGQRKSKPSTTLLSTMPGSPRKSSVGRVGSFCKEPSSPTKQRRHSPSVTMQDPSPGSTSSDAEAAGLDKYEIRI